MRWGSAVAVPVVLSVIAGCSPPGRDTVSRPAFVTVSEGRFWLDGKPFRFAGNNTYYLALSQTPDTAVVDAVLEANHRRGVRVMRIWAFWEGDSRGFQPQMGEYNEEAFQRLDLVLQKAGALGIKLILVLTNNWKDYGGMDQYVRWAGGSSHDQFYTNPAIQEAYRNYIRHMLTRVNSLTGVAYKEDPTIMAWQLANEPRCKSDRSGETIYRWASEVSAYMKSLDPNHLISTGEEGFFRRPGSADWAYNGHEGTDWERNLAIPTVDFAVFHLWIKNWEKELDWADRWILDHIAAARKAGRPLVLEEYGHYGPPDERNAAFTRWFRLLESEKIDGTMAWMMTEKGHDDGHPGFSHLGSTALLLEAHARNMK